jgi:hypothetical protein
VASASLRRDQGRPLQLRTEPEQVVEGTVEPVGRRVTQLCAEPERLQNGLGEVLRERHLGRLRDVVGKHFETGIRVDPPLARLPDRRALVERQARRVRKQVSHSGARRPGRLVQIDHAFLGGHERREGSHELRHRSPAKDAVTRPVHPDKLAVPEHADRDGLRRPALHLPQHVHGRRY